MKFPNFYYENNAWKNNNYFVAGVDEVGRGALAGPIVTGCVVFKKNFNFKRKEILINDSKKLTPLQRQKADLWIKKNSISWAIGEVSSKEIDKLGIVKATNKAIRKAINGANHKLNNRIDFLLIDAYYIPYIRGLIMGRKRSKLRNKSKRKYVSFRKYGKQLAIIKGDEKSISISSASIIAKVYRDNLMIDLAKRKRYKKYHWENNKGYGTKKHKETILRHGVSPKHRKTFIHL